MHNDDIELIASALRDLSFIASALAAISDAVARVDPHYQTLDRDMRITDALNAMAKRLGA